MRGKKEGRRPAALTSLLGEAYGGGPVPPSRQEEALVRAAESVRIADAAVRWQEVPRYSRSQRTPMDVRRMDRRDLLCRRPRRGDSRST
jgi:hypothetical protein